MIRIYESKKYLFFLVGLITLFLWKIDSSASDLFGMDEKVRPLQDLLRMQREKLENMIKVVYESSVRLEARTKGLQQDVEKLRGAAGRCRERIAAGEIKTCTVKRKGVEMPIGSAEALAKEIEGKASLCHSFQDQTARDKGVLENQLKVITNGEKELEEWLKANEEAQWGALKNGAEFVAGRFASALASRANSARALKGQMTRLEKKLESVAGSADSLALQLRIDGVQARYEKALKWANTGKQIQRGLKVKEYWEAFQNEVSAVSLDIAESDEEVRAMLEDPLVQKNLKKEHPDVDFEQFMAQKVLTLPMDSMDIQKGILEEIVGAVEATSMVSFSSFAVKFGYNFTKFSLSLDAINQQFDVASDSFRAATTLEKLIGKKKIEWDGCLAKS